MHGLDEPRPFRPWTNGTKLRPRIFPDAGLVMSSGVVFPIAKLEGSTEWLTDLDSSHDRRGHLLASMLVAVLLSVRTTHAGVTYRSKGLTKFHHSRVPTNLASDLECTISPRSAIH